MSGQQTFALPDIGFPSSPLISCTPCRVVSELVSIGTSVQLRGTVYPFSTKEALRSSMQLQRHGSGGSRHLGGERDRLSGDRIRSTGSSRHLGSSGLRQTTSPSSLSKYKVRCLHGYEMQGTGRNKEGRPFPHPLP